MKPESFFKSVLSCIVACAITVSSSLLYAEEYQSFTDSNKSEPIKLFPYDTSMNNISADVSANMNNTDGVTEASGIYGINVHKLLGWSTLAMTAITFGSREAVSNNVHCQLARVSTGLAAATCIVGYYKYGGLLSFSDGYWKINTHAVMGTLATVGFITAITLAGDGGSEGGDDNEEHVAVGVVSGVAFAVTLGVIHF